MGLPVDTPKRNNPTDADAHSELKIVFPDRTLALAEASHFAGDPQFPLLA